MSRPVKENKREFKQILVTTETHQRVKATAALAGEPMTDFIERIVLRELAQSEKRDNVARV